MNFVFMDFSDCSSAQLMVMLEQMLEEEFL